jgi:glycosyltransferase involved in cell wall biosynthesis
LPIRVLTIAKSYVAAACRKKIEALARDDRFVVGLVTPTAWAGQEVEPDGESVRTPYWRKTLPIAFDGNVRLHFYRGLHAAIEEFRPDVVNVEEEHDSLVTAQCFRAAVAHGAKPLFYSWQNVYKASALPLSWIERYVFKHAAAAMIGNQDAGVNLRRKGYKGLMREIPQVGADAVRFAPRQPGEAGRRASKEALGFDPAVFLISYFGPVVEEKGIQTLIQAAARLKAQGLGRVQILVCGDGAWLPQLRRLADSLLGAGWVVFQNQVKSIELPRYLQAVDVLCLPSLTRPNWREQFGRILVDGMAAEAVVVGSSSGEIPNVIGDSGIVFAEGNDFELAGSLKGLIRDKQRLADFRGRGADRVRRLFSNTVLVERMADLLVMVAGRQ